MKKIIAICIALSLAGCSAAADREKFAYQNMVNEQVAMKHITPAQAEYMKTVQENRVNEVEDAKTAAAVGAAGVGLLVLMCSGSRRGC